MMKKAPFMVPQTAPGRSRKQSVVPNDSGEPTPSGGSARSRKLSIMTGEKTPTEKSSIPSAELRRKQSMAIDPGESLNRRPSAWGGRPSLIGAMAANRMSMNLLRRFRSKQADSSVGEKPETPRPNLEPTYRTEPKSPFQAHKVEEIIQTSLEGQLKGRSYRPKIATMLCRMITNEIKENVKKLQYDRYRIVVNVVMGQKKEQGVMASSRCAWDDKRDDFAAHTFQAPDFFCTCSVYGVYKE